MRFCIVLCLLAFASIDAPAQPLPSVPSFARYSWAQTADNLDQWALLDNARLAGHRQIGVWEVSAGQYYPLVKGKWGEAIDPPLTAGLPPGCKRRPLPTGVDFSKIGAGDRVLHKGKEISHDEAMRILNGQQPSVGGDSRIPDESKKIRVSVIGSKEKTAGPLAIAKKYPEFVSIAYAPDAWMIQRQGFATPADPTIYIQKPDGTVIRRLDGYPNDLAFEVVLKEVAGRKIAPNPDYQKEKDEGWYKKRILPLLGWAGNVPWIPLAFIGGLLGWAVWSIRKKI